MTLTPSKVFAEAKRSQQSAVARPQFTNGIAAEVGHPDARTIKGRSLR